MASASCRRRCRRRPVRLWDADANLTHAALAGDLEALVGRAQSHGVARLTVPGASLAESEAALALCAVLPSVLVPTCGVHPYNAAGAGDFAPALRSLLEHGTPPPIVGECGLDYSEGFPDRDVQLSVFRQQIALAAALGRNLFLHERLAHGDFLAALRAADPPLRAASCLVHCFTGTAAELGAYLSAGFYVSVAGVVCKPGGPGPALRAALAAAPRDVLLGRLLLETDSPYLGFPGCRAGAGSATSRTYPNDPSALPRVLDAVAAALGVRREVVAQHAWANSCAFFSDARRLEYALRQAVKAGDVGEAQRLVADGDDVNVNAAAESDGWFPLCLAAKYERVECVRFLVNHPRIEINRQIDSGATSLYVSCQSDNVGATALLVGHPDILVNLARAETGTTPLYVAAEKNSHECLAMLLAMPGIDVNKVNNDGTSALSVGSQKNSEDAVKLLLARTDLDPNTEHVRQHATALYLTCKLGHLNIVKLLIADPRVAIDRARPSSGSPLFVAIRNHRTAIAIELIAKGADPNKEDAAGVSILEAAVEAHDSEAVAILIMRGASTDRVFSPLEAACARGNADAARRLALGGAESGKIPPLHLAILLGDGPAVAAACGQDGVPSNVADRDGLGVPALYYAIELGEGGMIAAVLGSALSRHAQMAAAVDGAVALPKLDGAYVPGTRYAHFAIRLIEAGLTETLQGCKAAITGYVGTIAASLHFDTKPDAFSALKRACTARLEAIAVPLEKIYHAEGLGSALGAIGAEFHGKVVRLDDEGLFPMAPTFLRATRPSMVSYEDFILPAIWLVSMALDAGFVLSLKRALAKFGSKVSVKAAPIKGLARMRNKLSNDHAMKKRPRPMHNLDAVRAGVVVTDASIMEEVFDTIGAEVGPWLRVKNNYREAFDATESYGYRALLGNLKYCSGCTCDEVFTSHLQAWDDMAMSLPAAADVKYATNVCRAYSGQLDDMSEVPVNIVAEVQIIYEPYLRLGRIKSSLHYKVARCRESAELVRDAAAKFVLPVEMVEAIEWVRVIVQRVKMDREREGVVGEAEEEDE